MLYLITGVPGAGKTLFSITTIEARRMEEKREVYYYGIKGLKYPWKEIPLIATGLKGKGQPQQAPDWQGCPDGSIIFIDEVWEFFPVRKMGSEVPDYVEGLATHRHHGLDIYMATQGRTQVDIFVRNLVGEHIHLDRKFGMQYSMLYTWGKCADPNSTADLSQAQNRRWMFPKTAFADYTSATEHTHKARLPIKKILTAVVCLVAAVAMVWYALAWMKPKPKEGAVVVSTEAHGVIGRKGVDMDYWAPANRQVRLAQHPESAPLYDKLQSVKSQPRVVGCMQLVRGSGVIDCRCAGPNHISLELSTKECARIVREGVFDETASYPDIGVEGLKNLAKESPRETSGEDTSAKK